tara:strand:+ start:1842 stop:2063 length:222 start_codon:yes stop_codon:yes gene_type:complete
MTIWIVNTYVNYDLKCEIFKCEKLAVQHFIREIKDEDYTIDPGELFNIMMNGEFRDNTDDVPFLTVIEKKDIT